MESISKTNTLGVITGIITLKGYYEKLPKATYPKSDFLINVASRCGVTVPTVRNWIRYGMKPNNNEHIAILSEMTGIDASNLWNR